MQSFTVIFYQKISQVRHILYLLLTLIILFCFVASHNIMLFIIVKVFILILKCRALVPLIYLVVPCKFADLFN